MSGLVSSRWHISGRRAGSSTSSSISRPTWTLRTPVKPSAGSARSTACPWGSRMPALGLTRTRARISGSPVCGVPARPPSRLRALDPGAERLAGDALVGLDVLLTRLVDDVVGDRGPGRVAIPAGAGGPVADVLLVKARLATAGLVLVSGPEARGVRGADLIADGQLAVGVETELELRVGEDDPVGAGVLGPELVERDRYLAHALGERPVTDELDGALEVDGLVVSDLGLGGRGEQRLGQAL